MKAIFLYLKSCPLDTLTLKRLTTAGYVAIAVESFDNVRVCEPVIIGHGQEIFTAAMHALTASHSQFDSVCATFGRRLAKTLSEKK